MCIWNRADLKARAKTAISRNYWRCVVVALILVLFVAQENYSINDNTSDSGTYGETTEYWSDDWYEEFDSGLDAFYVDDEEYDPEDEEYGEYEDVSGTIEYTSGIFSGFGWAKLPVRIGKSILYFTIPFARGLLWFFQTTTGAILSIGLIALSLTWGILISPLLEVGGCRFFVDNAYTTYAGQNSGMEEPARCGLLLSAFRSGTWSNAVWTQFLRNLYTFLWSLLFVIPGIVKSYEYRMIPWLLADYPDMPAEEAFRISKEMMYGNKWDTFVLELSFFLWDILNSVTFGIVGLFFVNPYKYATRAELYLTLKEWYFTSENYHE
ncbi:MAG: DUF975 family protein [Lachnospiraceae bacterium]|nr:DUF975 family protein [Lachnospiraceae bacterium]